jgi:MFS family permease
LAIATGEIITTSGIERAHRRLIVAASFGAIFEWYDFFLFGALAVLLSKLFFQGVNEVTSFIFALLGFGAGFALRPLGAVIFGRLGDKSGRKRTFLITILLMGLSTALVGALPTYETAGVLAPILLVSLRLLQGLALGGEFGGAVSYVAEHAPCGRRGYYTSSIRLTGTVGLALALAVTLICRIALRDQFEAWGWRAPFLLSIVLLAISLYIRLQLEESPVFKEMQRKGQVAKRPLVEALGTWKNAKLILLTLFGAMAGQSVIAYLCMVYVLFFLVQTLKLDAVYANLLLIGALVLVSPLFMLFGRISDRLGRKPALMAACLLTALTAFPIFHALTYFANPAIAAAQRNNPAVVIADPGECSFQFDPIGKARFTTSCDVAKSPLARANVPYANQAAAPGSIAKIRIGNVDIDAFDGRPMDRKSFLNRSTVLDAQLAAALAQAGYPSKDDPSHVNYLMVLALLVVLSFYVVLAYASTAAWLVELFPARIRYTSMSVPFHIGMGWIGGFLPSIAFAIAAYTGNMYAGLWYPVIICAVCFVVGTFFLPEMNGVERTA